MYVCMYGWMDYPLWLCTSDTCWGAAMSRRGHAAKVGFCVHYSKIDDVRISVACQGYAARAAGSRDAWLFLRCDGINDNARTELEVGWGVAVGS